MTFPKPETEKRGTPTKNAFEVMLIKFGRCPGVDYAGAKIDCDKPLKDCEQIEYDHIKALWAGGKNEPENWQPLCFKCHKIKSGLETTIRAKADRKAGRKGQYARRKKRGGSSIQSRGFDKTLTKGFDGKVRKRV